jgi:SAM-dependent methyltransferase
MSQFDAYARFYDLDLEGFDDDVLMVGEFAARCGSPILELACGTGRLLLPLASQGYRLTGVDVSPAMLERARHKLAAAGLSDHVVLVEQDMRELALDRRFNLAFAAVSSFQHLLTLDDQLATLARVRQHLAPGGILLVDLFQPDISRLLEPPGRVTLEKVMVDPDTGRQVAKFHTQQVDLAQQLIRVTYIVDEMDGEGGLRRTLFPYSWRFLFRGELELLLRHAGFEVEAVYGSYDLDEHTADSERLIAVARRPA